MFVITSYSIHYTKLYDLSGVMLLEHLGWQEAADLIYNGLETSINNKTVTYDFARLMEGSYNFV